jgi:hypothetical protein
MSIATPRRGFERPGGGGSSVFPDRKAGFWYLDDYINSLMSSFAVNGTATNSRTATSVGGHPGINLATVSAAATPDRASSDINNASSTFSTGGGIITAEYDLKITTLSNGTDNIQIRLCFAGGAQINSQADMTTGVYLEYDFAAHGSHNWFLCASVASVRTKTDTGVTANTQWTRLKLQLAADDSSLTAYINDVLTGATVSTNIPVINTDMSFGWQVVKQLGANPLSVGFDFIEVMQTFSSAR